MSDLNLLFYLPYPAKQEGYGVETVRTHRSNKTRGGLPRTRRVMAKANLRTKVQWTLDQEKYSLLVGFYEHVTANAMPFQMDAIAEDGLVSRCQAQFIPGTLRMTDYDGGSYTVTADVEVTPNVVDPADDEARVLLFEEYGEDQGDVLAALAYLATVAMVEGLG